MGTIALFLFESVLYCDFNNTKIIETFRPERTLSENEVVVEGHFCKYASTSVQICPPTRYASGTVVAGNARECRPIIITGARSNFTDTIYLFF